MHLKDQLKVLENSPLHLHEFILLQILVVGLVKERIDGLGDN
jgi:hypothetical protein